MQHFVGHPGCYEHPSTGNFKDVSQLLAAARRGTNEKRTTTTVFDAVTTLPQTLTLAQVTEIVTTTINPAAIVKRANAAALTSTVEVIPQPYSYDYVSSLAIEADQNAAIASSVSSACSCLYLAPKTVSSQATVRSVRPGYVSRAVTY